MVLTKLLVVAALGAPMVGMWHLAIRRAAADGPAD